MTVSFTTSSLVETVLPGAYLTRAISQIYAPDLNRDGYSDLVVFGASYPGQGEPVPQPSFVAFGRGDGTFTEAPQALFPTDLLKTIHPREVLFDDFNRDGFADVYVASHGYDVDPFPGEQNLLFLSNGDGTWRDASATLPRVIDFTHSATAADVNGDGHVDILVGNQTQSSAPYMLVNDGTGHFTRNDRILPTAPGGALSMDLRRVTATQFADLDNDGKADLVAGAAFSTQAQPVTSLVLWNQGGIFSSAASTTLPFPATFGATQLVYDVQAMDVDYDGKLDLVVAYQNSTGLGGWELQVLRNDGNRQFSDRTTTYLPDPALRTNGVPSAADPFSQYWLQFIEPADINGDGRMDFTINARGVTGAPTTLPIAYIHREDGTFEAATVAELGAGGNNWLFDYSTNTVQLAGGVGFTHLYVNGDGHPVIHVLPVDFATGTPWIETPSATPLTLVGGTGVDTLVGSTWNDRFTGAGGNDTIVGADGRDTAVYANGRASYAVTATEAGLTVQHLSNGAEGTDTLNGVERLSFRDLDLAFDFHGNAGMAYRLYQTAFARTPDAGGLGYQINELDKGVAITQVAANFIASAEFQWTYGNLDNTQFVKLLYRNVLHREPDAGGLAYYVNHLDAGMPRSHVLVGFSESVENTNNLMPAMQGGIAFVRAQVAAGTSSPDVLSGDAGNNRFVGGAGDDTIEGGGGLDVAIYLGARSAHAVARSGGGVTVADNTGREGVDSLVNVERLAFPDGYIAFDTAGAAGMAYRLYQAAFDRVPDLGGLGYQVNELDRGVAIGQVAANFIASPEFQSTYGNLDNTQFVTQLYRNVLDRAPDAQGLAFHVGNLNAGASRADVLVGFSESGENQVNLMGAMQNGIAYDL